MFHFVSASSYVTTIEHASKKRYSSSDYREHEKDVKNVPEFESGRWTMTHF